MPTTSDPNDPRLTRGVDDGPTPQAEAYLVLPKDERNADGFIRPVRTTYVHDTCGVATTMARDIAETYAREPRFYGATYCTACHKHLPVEQFKWDDGTTVGS